MESYTVLRTAEDGYMWIIIFFGFNSFIEIILYYPFIIVAEYNLLLGINISSSLSSIDIFYLLEPGQELLSLDIGPFY